MRISSVPGYQRANTIGAKLFVAVGNAMLILSAVLCLLPLLHLLAVSFSANGPASANQVGLIPVGFNVQSYIEVFRDQRMMVSILQSIRRVLVGVPINMALTLLAAYPLSVEKHQFPMRGFYSAVIVFTMLFSGGLIPTYVLINQLGLMNNLLALVLPGVPVFNVIIMLNFFRQLPKELSEAAFVDGAGHFVIMSRIYIPLSGAVFATLVLFCFVGHWNAWFDGLLYMRELDKYPLQTYIQSLVNGISSAPDMEEAKRFVALSRRSLLFARIVVSILPILIIYPYLQKYYKTGLVIGAVKG